MPITHYVCFVCDNCGDVDYVPSRSQGAAINTQRDKGWAVSRNRRKCYCPNCACNVRMTYARGMIYRG